MDGIWWLAIYDRHSNGKGTVPLALSVNSRPPVLCSDRAENNCVSDYQCVDAPDWVDDYGTDCHYWTNAGWCKSTVGTPTVA